MNVSLYSPLIESTYIELPGDLKHPRKGLINIQNDDNICFLWCHVRHLNFTDKNPQRITKKDEGIASPKIELHNKIAINVFCYENKVVYPVYLSDRNDIMDLLLILGQRF